MAERGTAWKWARPPAWVLAALAILIAQGALWPRAKVQPLSVFDQPFYLGIAYDLRHHGRFTNGYVFDDSQPRPPGMRFAPLYPALLAVAAALDPGFARATDCQVRGRGQDTACTHDAGLVRWVQFGMLALIYWLIWRVARRVTGSARGGAWALALALATAPELLGYVDYAMTEITALAFATAATAAAVRALDDARPALWMAASGVLLGLAALTRPAFLDLFAVCAVAGLAITAVRGGVRPALAFALAGVATVAPWIMRNVLVMHDAALTAGYGPQVLVQRIAFDQMSWAEWRLSLLCWLPDGNGLGNLLVGHGACTRFQWSDSPDTFYAIGNGPFMARSLVAAGGWPHMLGYLIRADLLAEPVKHAAVTLSLALRGAWISHYWGLLLMPVCAAATWTALRGRDAAFLVASLPAWFMLLFTAAVSVNQTRYNLMLILPFALAGARAVQGIAARRVDFILNGRRDDPG